MLKKVAKDDHRRLRKRRQAFCTFLTPCQTNAAFSFVSTPVLSLSVVVSTAEDPLGQTRVSAALSARIRFGS